MRTNEQRLEGNWKAGWALDLHTLSSVPRSDGKFDTKRTEIGEALYRLKYCEDKSQIEPIAETTANFLKETRKVFPHLAALIPVPPSKLDREFQPVKELAVRIGQKVNLHVSLDYLRKMRKTEPLKNLGDTRSRKKQLEGAFAIEDDRFAEKYVLLFDDLFRSGETLCEITRVLMEEGKAAKVFVLTITKTRTKR